MSTSVKVVLILIGVIVAMLVVGGVGVAYWVKANQGRLKAMGRHATDEGKAFAARHDADGCVTEALARSDKKGGIIDEVEHGIFLRACLSAAPRSPTFCDPVPKPDEMLRTATWVNDECTRRGHARDQGCGTLLQAVEHACWEK